MEPRMFDKGKSQFTMHLLGDFKTCIMKLPEDDEEKSIASEERYV